MLIFASLIARNSFRNPRRSILTILSIAMSFGLIGALMAMYSLFFLSEPVEDQALRLIVRNRISFANPVPISYVDKIKTIPGVREVMIQQWFGGTYKDPNQPENNFARFAIEPAKLFHLHPEYAIADGEAAQFLKQQDSCIVGRGLAERLGMKLGDRVTLLGDIFPARLQLVIAGIYESAIDNQILYFHNKYLEEALRKNSDYAIMLAVMVDSADSVTPVSRRIDALFRNSLVQTKTETEKAFRLNFLNYVGNIKMFLFVVCVSLAGTVLLVAANCISLAVRERTQEVGILKALGFTQKNVVGLIVGETMLLGFIGGLIGLCGAQVLIGAMRNLPGIIVSLTTLSLSPGIVTGELLLAALCGMMAAAPAAWRASRRPITDCLRETD